VKKTSYSGSWWLPENSGRRLAGELRYDAQDAIQLVLYDHLQEPDAQQFEFGPDDLAAIAVPLLHGRRHADSAPVTLIGVSGQTLGIPSSWVTNSFDVEMVLAGCHAKTDAFTRIDIEFDDLRTWAESHGRVDNSERNIAKIRTDQIELAACELQDGAKVALYTGVFGRWGDDGTDLMEHAAFSVEVPAPQAALDLVECYIKPLQDFLMVSLGVVVRLTEVRLSVVNEHDRRVVGTALFPVDQWPVGDQEPKSSQQWSQVFDYRAPTFLTAIQLLNEERPLDAGKLISRWLDDYESTSEVLRQLLAPFYTPFMSPEHRYSSTFQSAEALHQVLGLSPKDLPKPEHTERYERIIQLLKSSPDVPLVDAEWAAKVLPSRNDKSLAGKIEEILNGAGPAGAALLEAAPLFGILAGRLRGKVSHGGAHVTTARRQQRLVYELALRWIVRGHLVCRVLAESERKSFWERLAGREGFRGIVQALGQIAGEEVS
jgi:hypothetical protein